MNKPDWIKSLAGAIPPEILPASESVIKIANAENKALIEKLFTVHNEIEKTLSTVTQTQHRTALLEQHLDAIQDGIKAAELARESLNKNLATETNNFILIKNDKKYLDNQRKDLLKEISNIESRTNETFRDHNRIEKQVLLLQETLGTKSVILKDMLEEQTVIIKSREWLENEQNADAKFCKSLQTAVTRNELQKEKLTKQRLNLEDKIDDLRISLDKAQKQQQATETERNKLLEQWAKVVTQIHDHDNEIQYLTELYADVVEIEQTKKQRLSDLDVQYRALNALLAEEQSADIESEAILVSDTRSLNDIKLKLNEAKLFNEELIRQEKSAQKELKMMNKNVEKLEKELTKLTKIKYSCESQLKTYTDIVNDQNIAGTNAEARLSLAERVLNAYEEEIYQVTRDSDKARLNIIEEKNKVKKLKDEHKICKHSIQGLIRAAASLRTAVQTRQMERDKVDDVQYQIDYESQVVERKLARAGGEVTEREREEFNRELKIKEGELAKATKLVQTHTRELRTATALAKAVALEVLELQKATEKADKRIKELEEIVKQNEDCLLDLEKNYEQYAATEAKSTLELESCQKANIQKSAKLHAAEIGLRAEKKELLTLESLHTERKTLANSILRQMEEKCASLSKVQRESSLQTEREKRHYEELMQSRETKAKQASKIVAIDTTNLSTEAILVRTAEKKQELSRECKNLEAKVLEADRELQALSGTLKLFQ